MAILGTYTEDGAIIRASDGAHVPNDPANRDYAELMAAVDAGEGEIAEYQAPEPIAAPLGLQQVAAAQLSVDGWDVTGLERSTGIAGAFLLDTDWLFVLLTEEQADDTYIVLPADGVTKFTDHVEVQRPGLSNVSFIIQRVQ